LAKQSPRRDKDCFVAKNKSAPRNDGSRQFIKMTNIDKPPFGFVLVFLLFSLLFLSNTYKLWFKTDSYYQDIYNSLTNEKTPYPFKSFFLKRLENRKRWEVEQKIFSVIGFVAVIGADVLVMVTYLN
jgi:hypothetical protein